jgi:hypothetical protein
MPSNAFNVYNSKGRLIDTVFSTDTDALEVKRSLVNHDGFDPAIKVTKARKPKAKKVEKPVCACSGPVPHYDPKMWVSYTEFLIFHNID